MAAASPKAVASSASAMPGATTARLVVCDFEMPMKLFMMPQTVPNRPTNGAVAPIVASVPGPASAPVRQIQGFEERRILGSSYRSRSGDEPEIRTRQIVVRADRARHSPGDAQAIFGRGENPHRAGWASRRAQRRGAVPTWGHRREPILHLVEGVPGGWQAAPCGRHCAGGDEW